MRFVQFLEHVWNVPFLLAVALAAVVGLLQLVASALDADGDGDLDAEVDADVDTPLWPGVEPVPLTAVVLPFLFVGGLAGLFVNRLAWLELGRYPLWVFPIAALAAAIAGLGASRLMVRLAARLVDTSGRGAALKTELVGREGVVASAFVDQRFGVVRVRDDAGHEILVHARVVDGEPSLHRGASVVLVELEIEKEVFVAASMDAGKE